MNFDFLKFKTIKSKIFGLILFACFLMIVVLSISFYLNEKNSIKNSLNIMSKDYEKMFSSSITHEGKQLKMALESLLNNNEVISAFENGNREKLSDLLLQMFKEKLKAEYNVAQFQFHIPPATSFLRLHKPEKFGDDLSSFRKTVVEVNRNHNPVVGIEVGRGGAGLRVVLPVSGVNGFVGSVEFGGSLNSLVKVASETFRTEYALGIYDSVFKSAKRFANKENDVVKENVIYYSFSNKIMKNVIKNLTSEKDGYIQLNGNTYYFSKISLKDYSGKDIGNLVITKDITKEFASLNKKLIIISLTIFIISLLFGGAIFLILNKLLKPINLITIRLKEISEGEGDLTARLEMNSDDEFAEMGLYFNKFLENLQNMVGEVQKATESISGVTVTMASAMEEVSSTSTEIAAGVSDTNRAVDTTSASITEMSANLKQLVNSIQIMAENFTNIKEVTGQGAESVQQSVSTMEEIKQSSEKIENIVNVISEIAGQTNLLSLNAAIEAAKAGDQGKGFAVVAEEVRKLAERSGSAAKEISELILNSSNQVNKGSNIIQKAGEALNIILEEVNKTSDIVYQVNSASDEQQKGVEEIVYAVDTISNHTTQNATAAEEISHTIEEVTKTIEDVASQVDSLKDQVERFKV